MSEYQKRPRRRAELTKEAIEEALSHTYGNLKQACALFRYKDDTKVPWSTFYSHAKKYDLCNVAEAYKAELAYDALATLRRASLKDWKAAIEVLNRLGKLIDINPPPAKVEQKIELNSMSALMAEIDAENQRFADFAEYQSLSNLPRNGNS